MTKANQVIAEIAAATKSYNTNIKMFEYATADGQVLITCKTEKSLESNWVKYKRAWGIQ